jgi:hypothetical protein
MLAALFGRATVGRLASRLMKGQKTEDRARGTPLEIEKGIRRDPLGCDVVGKSHGAPEEPVLREKLVQLRQRPQD